MENKLARFFKATGAMRFFIPIGVILIVMGILMRANAPKQQYGETTGVVKQVDAYTELDADQHEETLYDVTFTYTVDGKDYENTFSGLTKAPAVGEKIPVYYDPDAPEHVSNTKHTGVIALAMIGLGAAAIVLSVLSGVKAFRKNRELDEQIQARHGGETPVVTPPAKDQLTEYYVLHDGNTLKPGYIVEDRARSVVYTAPMTKNALVGNRIFTFTDRRLGRTAEHEVGHTVTQSYSNEFFSTSSWFKFDGRNIWDVLHDRGVRVVTDLRSTFPKTVYTVSVNGRFLATVETSGRYVHEEDEAQHKVNIPVGRYYYRCWTDAEDLELLFLTVFAISETEQPVVE